VKWKLSGTHQSFEETADDIEYFNLKGHKKQLFDKFTNSIVLQYLHEYIIENPGIFEKAIGTLPDAVFNESNSNQNRTKRTYESKADSKRTAEIENQAKRTKAIETGQKSITLDRLNNIASTI
jgi:hypothetical protein